MTKATVLAIYGLVLFCELGQSMLVPLVPELAREFALSGAQAGALLSAGTLATLVAAVPAGLLAERFGALRISLVAGALICAAAVLQAVAGDVATFVAGRVLFGLGFAAIWTAGVTLLTGPCAPRGASAGAIAVGGVAHLAGPLLAGVLSEAGSRALPFWLMAAGAGTVTLLALPAGARCPDGVSTPGLRAAARAVGREPDLRGAVVLIGFIGALSGLVPLVVPLLLDREGLSGGEIGAVFAAGSLIWVVASAVATRASARVTSVGVAGAGLVLIAAAALLPAVALATPFLIGFVLLRAAVQAPLSAMNYGLGAGGARRAGVALGAAVGLLNVVWAAAATATPLLAGALLDGLGPRWVFAALALACAAAGFRMLRPRAGGIRPLPA
jgi:MFS family permease